MPSIQSRLIKAGIRIRRLTSSSNKMSVREMRQKFDELLTKIPVPSNITFEHTAINGVPCDWIRVENPTEQKIIFVHGGGYAIGSPRGYYSLAARIGLASNADVLLIDYKLAPEFPFPAGLSDVVNVYHGLLNSVKAHNIIFAGDSAGGGLIVAALMKLREENMEMPKRAILMCPWLDLTLSGDSLHKVKRRDPMLTIRNLHFLAKHYIGKEDPNNPFASPVFGNFQNFPPILVQAGEHDILRSDSERFAKRAKSHGVEVDFKIWKGMFHVWQFYARILPEAEQAVNEIGVFIRKAN